MTLTQLIGIFAAGIAALGFIAYGLQLATIAEQKRKEAKRNIYVTCDRADFEAQSLRKFQ